MGVVKHGCAKRSERPRAYRSWRAMRGRCMNPKDSYYHLYGGKGIKVCQRWDDFSLFLQDMGECPPGHSIDRKDSSKDYEPDNCRWATPKEQAHSWRKVTDEQVSEIRKLRSGGKLLREISAQFGIGMSHITQICKGHVRG